MPMDNAEKQKAYRDRERDRKTKHGSRVIRLECYKGTQDDIAYLMEAGGYTDEKELITILIRNIADRGRNGYRLGYGLEELIAI